MFYTSKLRTLAFIQTISELVCLHDSCMYYTTRVRSSCVTHSHSHKNSQTWLSSLAKTVNGRSKQVASVHFSFIPITALGAASSPKTHAVSSSICRISSLFDFHHSLIYFPMTGTIIEEQCQACAHIQPVSLSQSFPVTFRQSILVRLVCMYVCVCGCVRQQECIWNILWNLIRS